MSQKDIGEFDSDIFDFIYGSKPYGGLWFGEKREGEGAFWWRTPLRNAVDKQRQRIATLQAQLAERDARIKELEDAIRPFTHSDLCDATINNITEYSQPVYCRNKAVLTLADFVNANKALRAGE